MSVSVRHKFGASTEKIPFQMPAGEEGGNISYEEVNRSIAWQFGKANIPFLMERMQRFLKILPTANESFPPVR